MEMMESESEYAGYAHAQRWVMHDDILWSHVIYCSLSLSMHDDSMWSGVGCT
jgi:hypothetical protein